MSENDVTDVQDSASHGMTVSERLVQARESLGLSQKAVADELFLTTTFIRYIDDGQFEKIPKPAFIKGYLRSYARVVQLDGDELVKAFEREQDITPQAPRIADVTESAEPPSSFGAPLIQTGIAGLIGIIVVGALVFWIAGDDEEPPVVRSIPEERASIGGEPPAAPVASSAAPARAVEAEETAAVVAEPGEGADAPSTFEAAAETEAVVPQPEAPIVEAVPQSSTESAEPADEAASVDADTAEDAAGSDEIQIERVREDGVNYISVYAGGEATLGFEFSDECWVEISDGDGDQVYADLNRPGDVMTVYGKRPFDVLLGRAPGVRMTVDGEAIDLGRFTTADDTARVRTARL